MFKGPRRGSCWSERKRNYPPRWRVIDLPSLQANFRYFTTSQRKKISLRPDLGKNITSLRPSRLWLRVVLTSRVFASVCKTVSSPFSKASANHTCSWYSIWAILIKEQEKVLSSGGFRSSLLSAIDRVGQASTLYWFSREWSLIQNVQTKSRHRSRHLTL